MYGRFYIELTNNITYDNNPCYFHCFKPISRKLELSITQTIFLVPYSSSFGESTVGYVPNRPGEVFVITKVNNTLPWTYLIEGIEEKKLLELFTKKSYKKQMKKNLG